MDTQAQGPIVSMEEVEYQLSYLSIATAEHGLLIQTTEAIAGIKRIVDRYEAKLAMLEQQLADEKAKRETTRECAEIMSKQLSEARELLAANGIYEDWSDDERAD